MRLSFCTYCFLLLFTGIYAQDSLYTREVLKVLTSKNCFGRGYVQKGLQQAEKFITKEIRKSTAKPLFGKRYTQTFNHFVNTFPGICEVQINDRLLVPGVDYILDCYSTSAKGTCLLVKNTKGVYIPVNTETNNIQISFKKKLTFSVAKSQSTACGIELDTACFGEIPRKIKYNIEAKLISDFESKNIGCFIEGKNNDTVVVFSAHYDHLGGMGKHTFFAGANDNASGVSMVLNLIKYYSKNKPRYKTVFLFFAGEEAGLIGSKFFVESKAMDLGKIKFLINLDLLGTGDEGIMVVNGAIHQKELNLLTELNEKNHLLSQIKKRGKAANSDHYWFTEAGVPCFFMYTMGGIKAYHDVFDVEKTLPLTKYKEVYRLILEFVKAL